jgi:hypothetical protein
MQWRMAELMQYFRIAPQVVAEGAERKQQDKHAKYALQELFHRINLSVQGWLSPDRVNLTPMRGIHRRNRLGIPETALRYVQKLEYTSLPDSTEMANPRCRLAIGPTICLSSGIEAQMPSTTSDG